ncbi:MAG: MFS transporter, partial [Smithellaceae bacterium]|nr:MFS transporter [Smithellaceae bacterium]
MTDTSFKVYGYRWVVLSVFVLVVIMTQIMWIAFAPITGSAAKFYGVSDTAIGFLAMSFMVFYIPVSIPASWAIDTWGLRVGVGIGAVLTGVFGLTRGLFGDSYNWVLFSQIMTAIGQPFVLNAMTTVAARWFPITQRATAAGLAALGTMIGTAIGMGATPELINAFGGEKGIPMTMTIYGVASLVAAILFIIFAKDRPPTPPCPPGHEDRALVLDGLKHIFTSRQFIYLFTVFFIGLGIFNAVSIWINVIVQSRGITEEQTGMLGVAMLVAGVIGAILLPALSDKMRKRRPFLLLSILGGVPGLIGITFCPGYISLLIAFSMLGFFLTACAPIGF